MIGFGEGYIDSDGNFQWIDGGLILCPSASVSWSGQFAIGPVPAYWEASIGASINAQLNLYRNEAAKKIMPSGDISGSLSASVGAGAGVKKVLSLGGGITGTLSPLFRIYPQKDNYFRLDAKLNGYFKVTVVGLEYQYDTKKLKLDGTWIEAPKSDAYLMSAEDFDIYDSSQYELIDRGYVKEPSAFVANDIKLLSVTGNEETLMSNAYPYSSPQIARFDDGTELIVWLDDVRSREAVNRTAVYYSYFVNGVYTEPKIIDDDGTADFYPYLYKTGNTAYLAWSNEKIKLKNDSNMQDMLKNLETKTAEFDSDTHEFKNIYSIRNNDIMDIKPVLFGDSKIYCAWMSNRANSVDEYSGYNILISKKTSSGWSEAESYAENLNSIDRFAGYEQNGTPKIAYCADTDGDINTVDDIRLYADGKSISDEPGMKTNVVSCDHELYWYDNASIRKMDIANQNISIITPADEKVSSDNFKVISAADGTKYVIFSEYNGLYSEVFGYSYDAENDVWSRKIKFTDTKQCIESFDADTDLDGNPVFAVNRIEVIGDYENNNLYGAADLVRISSDNRKKLEIADVDYDTNYAVEGNDVEISAVIKNGGMNTETFNLEIPDKNAVILIQSDEVSILPGETKDVVLELPLEAETEKENLKIRLLSDGVLSEKVFSLKHEDVAVENISYIKTENNKFIISADIVNRGCGSGDVVVKLREDAADGKVILEKT